MSSGVDSVLADRLDVIVTVGRYGRAIDMQDWSLLRSCLADVVHVDFSRYSSPQGPPPADRSADDWVGWVREFVGSSIRTEHLTANVDVELSGESARAVFSLVVRRHQETLDAVRDNTSHAIARYHLERIHGRWLITVLSADLSWLDGDPTLGQAGSAGRESRH